MTILKQLSTTKKVISTVLLCLSTMVFSIPSSYAASQINIRVYSSLPENNNSAHYLWYARFKENLANKTGDKVKFNFFPNAMLGKEADAAQQVKVGALDIMISGTSIWSTLVPEIGILDSGYLFNNMNHVGRSLDGDAGNKLAAIMQKKANIQVLGFGYSLGARNIYTKKPVNTPEDLNSLKIRALPVPNFLETIKSMGAVPIPMPGGEVYSGLQMGVIDGVEHDAPTVLTSKYYEQTKNAILSQHIYNPIVAVMNKQAFERLPSELKQEFLAAAKEATQYERSLSSTAEQQAISELKSLGVNFIEVDRAYYKEKTKHVHEDFVKKYPQTQEIVEYIYSVE